MFPLIDGGHLYIAQPPLFKVKKGKIEEYIDDEKGLEQFLIRTSAGSMKIKSIKTGEKYAGKQLEEMLELFREYRFFFDKCMRHGYSNHVIKLMLASNMLKRDTFSRKDNFKKLVTC